MLIRLKYFLTAFLLLSGVLLYGGPGAQLTIEGQIVNQDNTPVQGQEVRIVIDGDTSIHINNLITDSIGHYTQTVTTPDQSGIVLVYIYDCNSTYHEKIRSFDGNTIIQVDFEICTTSPVQCETNFYFIKDSINQYTYSFYDNTTANSNIVTYQWDFDDNTTSGLSNPVHTYTDTGKYNVHLKTWSANGCFSEYNDTLTITIDTSACSANFYFQKDTSSGLMNYYHFFNNSIPSDKIVSYSWDFDDGNYSTQENPSHQFQAKGVYKVELTITTASGCTSLHSHRIIIDQDIISTCNASFGYIMDTTNNSKEVHFFDISTSYGSPIVDYYWDFGDGAHSIQKNPVHTFPYIGVYNVSLTIMTQDSCISDVSKKITIGNPSYYLLGGQVFFNSMPVDTFKVILFRDINNYLQPVDTASFDTLGYYYFIDVIEGDYKVKIFPTSGSAYVDVAAPTYHNSDLFWDVSQIIILNDHKFNSDVDLINMSTSSGIGQVNGQMFYNMSSSTFNVPLGSLPGLEEKNVYFLDKNSGTPVKYTTTITDGYFTIDNLPFGDYQVYADFPGKYCDPVDITLSQNNPVIDSVLLQVTDDNVSGIVKDKQDHFSTAGNIYPNPAHIKFFLPLHLIKPESIIIKLYSINGELLQTDVYEMSAGHHNISLSYPDLEKGMYFMTITTPDKTLNNKQKVIIY
ncbi:MAG: PKD domain-containing protein [Bacteroidales bacterium]|nr:PKD domain-containing protein [Bacteroidales bacterium]